MILSKTTQAFLLVIEQLIPKSNRFWPTTQTHQSPGTVVINQPTTHSKLNRCIQQLQRQFVVPSAAQPNRRVHQWLLKFRQLTELSSR